LNHADFGKYLVQQRELRGMSRAEVAKATKIPDSVLGALESGQVERLPGRIFVLNYIRAYAQVIGLAEQEAVLRYEELDRAHSGPGPEELERARRRRAWLTLVGVLLAVGAAVAAFALWERFVAPT
jgi:cytoskeletal protein RodZ